MEEDEVRLEEETVLAYGIASDDYERSRKSEVKKDAPKPNITGSVVSESGIIERPTSVEFELTKPFLLILDDKSQDVKYSTTPKVDK